MGWTPLDGKLIGSWMPPGVTVHTHVMHIERVFTSELPDPFTDANDCNALIKHLKVEDYSIEINMDKKAGDTVRLTWSHGRNKFWRGDNWMHGVCELALKVLT